MNTRNNRGLIAMGLGTVLGAGLLATAARPGSAQVILRSRYSYSQDYDQDGIPNWQDPHPRRADVMRSRVLGSREVFVRPNGTMSRYSRTDDIDGDGIPNWMDRDRDGDGTIDMRDRDRDGDGVPDFRDAHPNNPRRR